MTLGRRKALSPTLTWLEEKRAELENSSVSNSTELLTLSFPEWCQSLKIKTPNGLRPFELFDWQKQTAELMTGDRALVGRTIVVLSSRQTGKTSLFLALGAYFAQSTAQMTGVYVHKTGKDSGLLARRLKRFLSGLKLRTDSLGLIELVNNSMLHFRSANPARGDEGAEGAGRGLDSVDVVIIEESGHTSNLAAVQGVIGPAMTFGYPRLSVLVGTAGSEISHYHKLLAESAGGADRLKTLLEGIRQGTEKPFQILNREGPGPVGVISNWRCVDEFRNEPDFLGRVQRELNLSDEQIASEYEMVFSSGGDSAVFDFALVQQAATGEVDGAEDIQRGGIYYAGVDPAAAGKDFTVCAILHHSHGIYRLAAVYRKRSGTSESHLGSISDLLNAYNPISTVVEANSIGALYLENLTAVCRGQHIQKFVTTQTSKELLTGKITLALERGELIFPPGVARDELLSFRRSGNNGQKLGAATGSHDDVVIALGLALVAAQYGKHVER